MNSYTLSTLLKVRQKNRDLAEQSLLSAKQHLEDEQRKLRLIEEQLQEKRHARAQMQDHFFERAQHIPCNKLEVNCLAFSAQKNLCDEQALKNSLIEQREYVKIAESNKEAAFRHALEANRDLKAIDKHHVLWQQREKRSEDLKVEYDADDQNGVRFWLNRRV